MVDPAVDELPPRLLETQRRWVRSSGLLLGLASEVPARAAEVVARLLGVAGTLHDRARREWAEARDIRARSSAVVSILALVSLDVWVVMRLLGAGSVTGAFGPASVWEPSARRRTFPVDGTAGSGRGRCRAPPPLEIGSL